MTRYPLPLCALCGDRPKCDAAGQPRPDYPRCKQPLLRPRLDRLHALVDDWRLRHGDATPPLRALLDGLCTRFAADRERFSEIFEPSFSWDEGGAHFRRFSYAFPGFRGDESAAPAIASLLAGFGAGVARLGAAFVRAARHPAVLHPLLGAADDGERGLRLKLYLQFRDDGDAAARALTSQMIGARSDDLPGRLHMLGLDAGARGLSGAKLYFVPPPDGRVFAPLGRRLARALDVYRLDGNGASARLSDVDFALAENECTEADLFGGPLAADYADALRAFAGLRARFAVAVRRVSIAHPPARRLTLYYVPTETEPTA